MLFEDLEAINSRPEPFEFFTARDLWTDGHISEKLLSFTLDENVDVATRTTSFIRRSLE